MWNDPERGGLCLFVNTPNGSIISLRNLRSCTAVKDVKERLELDTGIPGELTNISYALRSTKDDDSLSALGIKNGSVLRLYFRSTEYEQLYEAVIQRNMEALFTLGVLHFKHSVTETDNDNKPEKEVGNTETKYRASVALFMASAYDNIDVLETLLQNSALAKDFHSTYGRTAMHVAAFHNSAANINFLLGYGFDPTFRDNNDMMPLQIAKLHQCPHSERRLWLAKLSLIYPSSQGHRQANGNTEIRDSWCDSGESLQVKESHDANPAHSKKYWPLPHLTKKKRLTKTRSAGDDSMSEEISLPLLKDKSELVSQQKESQLLRDELRGQISMAKGKEASRNSSKIINDTITIEESSSKTGLVNGNPTETLNDLGRGLPKYERDDSELETILKQCNKRKLIKSLSTNTLERVMVDLRQPPCERMGKYGEEKPLLRSDNSFLSKLTLSLKTERCKDLVASKDKRERDTEDNEGTTNCPGASCLQEKLSSERHSHESIVMQNLETCDKQPDIEPGVFTTSLEKEAASEESEMEVTSLTLTQPIRFISHILEENRRLSFDEWLSRKRCDDARIVKRSHSSSQCEESQKSEKFEKNGNSEAFKTWLARKRGLERRHSAAEYDVVRTSNKIYTGLTFEEWLEGKKNETSKIKDHAVHTIVKQALGNKPSNGLTHEQWLEKKRSAYETQEALEDRPPASDEGKRIGLSFEKWLQEKENSSKIEMIRRATKLEGEKTKRSIEQYKRLSSGRVLTFSEWLLIKKNIRTQNCEQRQDDRCQKNPAGDSKLVYDMWMLNKHIQEMAEEEKKTVEMRQLWDQKRRQQMSRGSKV